MHDLEQQDMKRPLRVAGRGVRLAALAVAGMCVVATAAHAQTTDSLPDAPSALLFPHASRTLSPASSTPAPGSADTLPVDIASLTPSDLQQTSQQASPPAVDKVLPCPKRSRQRAIPIIFLPSTEPTCQDQLQLIVDTGYIQPLTSPQKGVLAIRAVIDPFNLLTIATFSGISVAANSHSVYGPGFKGWGRLAGYSLSEDAQMDFTGIYVIPSLVHEDPRYHRMPKASVKRRIEHALIHTFVSQHDDGSLMPNYATLINIPLSAEISNLYVPDIGTNAPDTAKRVLVGYATDPIGPLVAEFLPDFAKRVHVHIIFAQQILNRLALGSGASSSSY